MPEDGFYEEDEPLEHIRSILRRPPDGLTERPAGSGIDVTRQTFARVRIVGDTKLTQRELAVDQAGVSIS